MTGICMARKILEQHAANPNHRSRGNTAAFLHVGAEELTEHFCVRAAHFLAFPARKDLTPDAVQALQARLLAKRRAVERAVERAAGSRRRRCIVCRVSWEALHNLDLALACREHCQIST